MTDIGRTIALRINELRLQQALEEAHRARMAFLREDLFDGDCERCMRKVREAEARAARLQASLHAIHGARTH
jgi:peptide subunit release factor RF-3